MLRVLIFAAPLGLKVQKGAFPVAAGVRPNALLAISDVSFGAQSPGQASTSSGAPRSIGVFQGNLF